MKKPMDIAGPLSRRRFRALRICTLAPLGGFFSAALPRLFDLSLSLLLLALLLPFLLLRGVAGYFETGGVWERNVLIGRFREPFQRLGFAGSLPGRSTAVLLNVLRGDLALAGPRPLTPAEAESLPAAAAARFSIRPGLFSPHRLRRSVGIAHEAEHDSDSEFIYGETVKGNIGLVLRSSVIGLLQGHSEAPPPMLDFFGVPIVNTTMDEAVGWIVDTARSDARAQLAFVNPDCLNIAHQRPDYKRVLKSATRVLPDGIGIHLGCRLLGTTLAANVNGTDLFPRLCERIAAEPELSLFLLGAQPGVAELTANNMRARYPGLSIAGVQHGFFNSDEEEAVIERINASGARILLVAFGAPKQDFWLARHRQRLTPPLAMGVGGLFDFYSGRIPRAPLWMREIGLEWVWRLMQEPGRMWRRYVIGNPVFLYRVWKQARAEGDSGVHRS